ncbi:MAG: hypothetical protein LBV41_09760 [Cytophagaceae bacterium]|nr:hypothetical protein [Cytophagaceae bacterium]
MLQHTAPVRCSILCRCVAAYYNAQVSKPETVHLLANGFVRRLSKVLPLENCVTDT